MTEQTSIRRATLDIALTFSRQFLGSLMQLAIIVSIARYLGEVGAGFYAVSLLLPTVMAALLSFGLPAANVYFLASGQRALDTIWSECRDFTLFIAVIGTLAALGLIHTHGAQLFPGVPSGYLFLAVFIFPLSAINQLLNGVFQALRNFRAFNLTTLCQPTIAFSGIIALLLTHTLTLERVFILLLFSQASTIILALAILSRTTSVWSRRRGWNYLPEALRYGYKAHLGQIATLLISRSDLLLVNWFLGPAAAGIYIVAVRIVEQLWMVSQSVSVVLFPTLSAMTESKEQRLTMVATMIQAIFWIMLISSALLFFISKSLISIIFGAAFIPSVLPLMILLPGVVLFSSSRVLANDFAARNLVHINLMLTLATLTVNISGNLWLIPRLGIGGAALATSIAYALNHLIRLYLYNRITGMNWMRTIIPVDLLLKLRSRKKN